MIRFEDLLEKVRAYSPDTDVELLRRAYVFSAFEHRGQVRHSGEPYLIHPLAVADFLADMKLDAVAIAAGLLHDVVEDTLTTIERIEELFNPLNRRERVFDDIVEEPGGNGDRVELHVGQKVGDGKGMNQVWFTGMAYLSPMLERREDIGAPQQLNVGVRTVGPDLFEEILEANHGIRCLK